MKWVDVVVFRIRIDAAAWVAEFESALERVAICEDRSRMRLRSMRPEEMDYRTSGPLFEDDEEGDAPS